MRHFSKIFSDKTARFCAAGIAGIALLALSGCAVLDSHNVIGRMTPPTRTGVMDAFAPLTQEERMQVAQQVWTTVNERYIDPKMNGIDWQAVRAQYWPRIEAVKSETDYWDLLDQMVGELGDSHTRVESPARVRDRVSRGGLSYGIALSRIDGAFVVLNVHPDSDAWFAGVRPGMLLERIGDEAPTTRYATLHAQSRKQSTEWIRERQVLRKMLEAKEKGTLSVRVRRDDNTMIEATLQPRTVRALPTVTHRTLPSGFGYVRFSGFEESLRAGVLAAINELKDTPGLIIDLRGNPGGSGAMVAAIAARFMEKKTKPLKILARNDIPVRLLGLALQERFIENVTPAGKDAYTKSVVLLTDVNSASASEALAASLRELGNTTVVGQTSCGCLLGFLGYLRLPGGAEMAYSESGFLTASGKRVEREGIVPDVMVPLTRENLRSTRDVVLERAVEVLRGKTAKG